jgi:hypothetical protein
MFGCSGMASARAQAQQQAAHAQMIAMQNRQMMDARAYALWKKHGDAYAGMDWRGNPILWRETTIPAVRRA